MARKDRHTFLVGRRASVCAMTRVLSRAFGKSSGRADRTAENEVRPVFFLNPWGEDRGAGRDASIHVEGVPTGLDSL